MLRSLRLLVPILFLCGTVLAAESIPLDQLPRPVVDAIQKRHPGATLLSAERDERNDFVYFFVEIDAAGEKKRIEIDEYGRFAESP